MKRIVIFFFPFCFLVWPNVNISIGQDKLILIGQVLNSGGQGLKRGNVDIAGIGRQLTSDGGFFKFGLPWSKYRIGDNIELLFSKTGWLKTSSVYELPFHAKNNPLIVRMEKNSNLKKNNISISFKISRGGTTDYKKDNFHFWFRYIPDDMKGFSGGLEIGYIPLINRVTYTSLPGIPPITANFDPLSLYGSLFLHYSKKTAYKNVEPYVALAVGAPAAYQLIGGVKLFTLGTFMLGMESRFYYFKSEVVKRVIFNNYRDALTEIGKKESTGVSFGLNISYNFNI